MQHRGFRGQRRQDSRVSQTDSQRTQHSRACDDVDRIPRVGRQWARYESPDRRVRATSHHRDAKHGPPSERVRCRGSHPWIIDDVLDRAPSSPRTVDSQRAARAYRLAGVRTVRRLPISRYKRTSSAEKGALEMLGPNSARQWTSTRRPAFGSIRSNGINQERHDHPEKHPQHPTRQNHQGSPWTLTALGSNRRIYDRECVLDSRIREHQLLCFRLDQAERTRRSSTTLVWSSCSFK